MSFKAVVDTNVVVSGIFWKGTPYEILKAWREGRFRLVLSPVIFGEYRRVLYEMTQKHASPALTAILATIESHSETVEPASFGRRVCSDPDDDKFLEAAVAAQARYVVSGDAALLRVKNYGDVQVVKPAQFLGLLPS